MSADDGSRPVFVLCDRLLEILAEQGMVVGEWDKLPRSEAIAEIKKMIGVTVSDDIADWWAYWRDVPPTPGTDVMGQNGPFTGQDSDFWISVLSDPFYYDTSGTLITARRPPQREWPHAVWLLAIGDPDIVTSPITAGTEPYVYETDLEDGELCRLEWGPGDWEPIAMTIQQWIETRIKQFKTGRAWVSTAIYEGVEVPYIESSRPEEMLAFDEESSN